MTKNCLICDEAAYARGLGTPVINTCLDPEIDDAHFDTKQLNHILWNAPGDLLKPLRSRIVHTVGVGPYDPEMLEREREARAEGGGVAQP